MAASPGRAWAAGGHEGLSVGTFVMLPFLVGLSLGLHVLVGRAAKAVIASAMPLASGQPEMGGYERRLYGTAERSALEVVGLAASAGVVWWVGMAWGIGLMSLAGVLVLLGAIGLDLRRWERVTVSASCVWFQRGLGHKVHQVAIENIRDVSVTEADAPGFTLRHLNRNRVCRLSMRMNDKRVVALPKTDALAELEAVENTANLIRTRLQLAEDRESVKRSGERGTEAAAALAEDVKRTSSADKEMMRELRRLRRQAQTPQGVPPAVEKARKA